MRIDANAYSQMSLLDVIPQEQKAAPELGRILYARVDRKKVVYYVDKECTAEWTRGTDSSLTRETLDQSPVHFTMVDGFTYFFDKIVWVDW